MHTCPDCYRLCTCGGDIDDIDFGDHSGCSCDCWNQEPDDYDPPDYEDDGPQDPRGQPEREEIL